MFQWCCCNTTHSQSQLNAFERNFESVCIRVRFQNHWQLFIMIMASQTFHIKFRFFFHFLPSRSWFVHLTRLKLWKKKKRNNRRHEITLESINESAMKRIFLDWIAYGEIGWKETEPHIMMTNGFMWGEYMRTRQSQRTYTTKYFLNEAHKREKQMRREKKRTHKICWRSSPALFSMCAYNFWDLLQCAEIRGINTTSQPNI